MIVHATRDPTIRGPVINGYDGFGLFANIVSDYLSLFIIKRWLRHTSSSPLLSFVGALVTAICFIFILYTVKSLAVIFVFFSELYRGGPFDYDPHLLMLLLSRFYDSPKWLLLSAGMWPAIAVHAWIPLMGLSILAIKGLSYTSRYVGFFRWLLKDGDQNPFEAVAYAAASIVFAFGLIWKGIDLLKA